MCTRDAFGKFVLAGAAALGLLAPLDIASANGFSVLYSFTGGDGATPTAGLIKDAADNLYGTTFNGGAQNYGVVFKVAPDGSETVLYAFTGGSDGAYPDAGLIADEAGNLYGTADAGGDGCVDGNCGTVFKFAPDGTESVLHAFTGGRDGYAPQAGLIRDAAGNLYGTTAFGGKKNFGVVFKVAPDGTETVLHAFAGGSDGANSVASLIKDKAGNLYGTTSQGGTIATNCSQGCGTVFRLVPDGTETVLYAFTDGSDGAYPVASLIRDRAGNLYGTTSGGGGGDVSCEVGCGTVFKLAPDGTETVLYAFAGGSDGAHPVGNLILDKAGNLYSTTEDGGANNRGTVFKLAPDGTETVLHVFKGGGGGAYPDAGLTADTKGYLYGPTFQGGAYRDGTVFKVKE